MALGLHQANELEAADVDVLSWDDEPKVFGDSMGITWVRDAVGQALLKLGPHFLRFFLGANYLRAVRACIICCEDVDEALLGLVELIRGHCVVVLEQSWAFSVPCDIQLAYPMEDVYAQRPQVFAVAAIIDVGGDGRVCAGQPVLQVACANMLLEFRNPAMTVVLGFNVFLIGGAEHVVINDDLAVLSGLLLAQAVLEISIGARACCKGSLMVHLEYAGVKIFAPSLHDGGVEGRQLLGQPSLVFSPQFRGGANVKGRVAVGELGSALVVELVNATGNFSAAVHRFAASIPLLGGHICPIGQFRVGGVTGLLQSGR